MVAALGVLARVNVPVRRAQAPHMRVGRIPKSVLTDAVLVMRPL
jgi:hypothetical protein